jgi:hypothetical protein
VIDGIESRIGAPRDLVMTSYAQILRAASVIAPHTIHGRSVSALASAPRSVWQDLLRRGATFAVQVLVVHPDCLGCQRRLWARLYHPCWLPGSVSPCRPWWLLWRTWSGSRSDDLDDAPALDAGPSRLRVCFRNASTLLRLVWLRR